jgi:hypothetical protein
LLIETEDLDEIIEHVKDIVRMSGITCYILGDIDKDIIYSIVFGTYEAAVGALEGMNLPGASILYGIESSEGDRDDGEGQLH